MKHLFLSLLFLCFAYCIQAQNSCYKHTAFEDFLETSVTSDSAFAYVVYKNIKYPAAARIAELEEIVDVVLIYHGKNPSQRTLKGDALVESVELIPMSANPYFKKEIKKLATSIKSVIKENQDPFITRFFVLFKLDPFPTRHKHKDKMFPYNTITVLAYRVPLVEQDILIQGNKN